MKSNEKGKMSMRKKKMEDEENQKYISSGKSEGNPPISISFGKISFINKVLNPDIHFAIHNFAK